VTFKWTICGVDGCLVSPYDRYCPACEFRLLGARIQDDD
jgi:hypothetical protein